MPSGQDFDQMSISDDQNTSQMPMSSGQNASQVKARSVQKKSNKAPNLKTSSGNYYDPMSDRAREARLGQTLAQKPIKIVLLVITLVLAFLAVLLLIFLKKSLGWLFLGLAIPFAMVLTWAHYELSQVPPRNTGDINDILSLRALNVLNARANLRKQASTTESELMGKKTGVLYDAVSLPVLASGLIETRSGKFLAARYGITKEVLEFFANYESPSLDPVFVTARRIAEKIDAEVISGGILAVAIVENYPEHDYVLRQLKLELSDLYDGLIWYNHLHGLIKGTKGYKRNGGIARDFAFGYIPLLERFGVNISMQQSKIPDFKLLQTEQRHIVDQIIGIFSAHGRQNVTLIGPEGSGRTTLIRALAGVLLDADAKISNDLKYRQIIMLDANSLIAAVNGAGQLENLVMQIFTEAYNAKNIILCLENAEVFFEEGPGSVNIAGTLLPILEAGRLRMVLTMNEQKYLKLAAEKGALSNALNKIMVPPTDYKETIKIMQNQVPFLEAKYNVLYTFWALTESYRLGERYVPNLVMPGKALNLLEAAARYSNNRVVVAESVQRAVEQMSGVKLASATTAENKSRLLNLENLIHERMIDQEGAVKAVSDALRRSATGVRNEKRPIGTFLFIGPTGVGKTELAKSLAAVYFGGEGNLARIDLNEYVTAEDVARLIAEGKDNPESLTAQIMKQPFSVVLLDEIEKAHPLVLTTLLQMLDEGILRDVGNHEVSFRDAIVIATSNADPANLGAYFKPEFLNRFDEICEFQPLSPENLAKVLGVIMRSVNQTLAPQKIRVVLDENATALLVQYGYDPKMGARPMRRIVQKTVENLVARQMLTGNLTAGAELHITGEMIAQELRG